MLAATLGRARAVAALCNAAHRNVVARPLCHRSGTAFSGKVGKVEKLEATVAGQEQQIETLIAKIKAQAETFTAKFKEQATEIERVSAQLEASNRAPEVVNNKSVKLHRRRSDGKRFVVQRTKSFGRSPSLNRRSLLRRIGSTSWRDVSETRRI